MSGILDQNLNIASDGVIFTVGNMWARQGSSGAYNIPFGTLQEFQLDGKYTFKELMDPNFLTAIAAGTEKQEWTCKAKWAAIRAEALQLAMGGTLVTSNPGTQITTLSIGQNNNGPIQFACQIKSGAQSNPTMTGILYACLSEQISIQFKPRDYLIPDISFKLFVDPVALKVLDLVMLGDQTADPGPTLPVAPASPSATTGATTGAVDLAWSASSGATNYNVYRSTTSGGTYIFVGSTVGVKFTDYGTTGTTYYYTIAGVNGSGEGALSSIVNAAAD